MDRATTTPQKAAAPSSPVCPLRTVWNPLICGTSVYVGRHLSNSRKYVLCSLLCRRGGFSRVSLLHTKTNLPEAGRQSRFPRSSLVFCFFLRSFVPPIGMFEVLGTASRHLRRVQHRFVPSVHRQTPRRRAHSNPSVSRSIFLPSVFGLAATVRRVACSLVCIWLGPRALVLFLVSASATLLLLPPLPLIAFRRFIYSRPGCCELCKRCKGEVRCCYTGQYGVGIQLVPGGPQNV